MKTKSLTRTQENTVLKFWKDNRLDAEYTMTVAEFKKGFIEWLPTKEKAWHEYYGCRNAVVEYVGRALNSVADMTAYNLLAEDLRKEYWDIVELMNDDEKETQAN